MVKEKKNELYTFFLGASEHLKIGNMWAKAIAISCHLLLFCSFLPRWGIMGRWQPTRQLGTVPAGMQLLDLELGTANKPIITHEELTQRLTVIFQYAFIRRRHKKRCKHRRSPFRRKAVAYSDHCHKGDHATVQL